MGVYEDVEDLKSQIKRSVETNNKKEVAELLKLAFSLCVNVKELLKTADTEEKKKLNAIMQDFRKFLSEETARLSKKMGLTEEQFARYNENPENFSKEQWAAMQMIKQKFNSETKEIRKVARKNDPRAVKIDGLPENWVELIEGNPYVTELPSSFPSTKKKKKVHVTRTKKSKWMKS